MLLEKIDEYYVYFTTLPQIFIVRTGTVILKMKTLDFYLKFYKSICQVYQLKTMHIYKIKREKDKDSILQKKTVKFSYKTIINVSYFL